MPPPWRRELRPGTRRISAIQRLDGSAPTSAAGRSTAQGAVWLRGLYRGCFTTPHRYPASRSAWSETGRPSRLWISGQLSPAARRRSTSAFSVSVQRCSPGLTPTAARCAAPGGRTRPRCRQLGPARQPAAAVVSHPLQDVRQCALAPTGRMALIVHHRLAAAVALLAIINARCTAALRAACHPCHAHRSERTPDDGLGSRDDAGYTRDRKPPS